LRKVLLPVLGFLALVLAFGGTVWADTVDDPLHGFCNGTGTGICSDNQTNTPLGNSTTFGFSISPGPQTGDLLLDILVPNNYTIPVSTPEPSSLVMLFSGLLAMALLVGRRLLTA
jgi:hypothetical protein